MFQPNQRILLVDDNPAIHEDFRKILIVGLERSATLDVAESVLFGTPTAPANSMRFTLESTFQGREALEKVVRSVETQQPYAMAFVDVRMPPGWDGIETIEHLWKADPLLQIVVCTAYSDYSWEKMSARLGVNDNLVILKKPFDNIEVLQLAHALTKKWNVTRQARVRVEELDRLVGERTALLQSAHSELQRSEERFAKAFLASPLPLAIQVLDSGRFVAVNEAFIEIAGISRAELIGHTPLDVRLLIDFPTEIRERIRSGHSVREIEANIATRGDDLRQILVSFEPMTIADEPHVLLMAQDISERLRLESQLRQSQKMDAIGQLAAGVAHDFNNLLTIIQGHASLQIGHSDADSDLADSLNQIEHAAERAADLTRQLLAFSRRQIMRPRVLSLTALIDDLTTMLRRLLGATIVLRCDLPPDLPRICADQTGIEQILMNLALNARDAIQKSGEITIAVRAVEFTPEQCGPHPEPRPGQFICLSVTDTGTGMSEITRARIFEPFFTTKEINKGTGMGLATVYGVVHQHEGWIEVATAPGSGSTFSVYLPSTDRLPDPSPEIPARSEQPRRDHTVLVVEDDHAVRGLVREVLILDRYHVLEAENADDAMVVWQKNQSTIDLLLTDMVMPGSANGLELAQRLLAEKPSLKVVYTSGYSAELFGSDVELVDGLNYLPKPYLSNKLIGILRSALEPAKAER